jgi:NAD(P)H-hydrate epimerase
MVDAKQMRRLETNANELGVSNAMMMARAGQAVAEFVLARPDAGAILFCGKGNNGGDGLAAASLLLQAKRKVHVILVEGRVDTPLAKELLSGLPKKAVTHWEGRVRDGWQENDHVLVDAMLGVGFHGKMSGAYAEAARFLSTRARAGQVVLSVDVPSGLGAPGAVQPTHTLALHAMKAGMTKKNSGTILAADIGVPAKAEECGLGDLDAAYPRPKWESRKGDNGRVLIIGGSIPYVGAVHYAAMAAFRSGADLVHVVAPSECASALRAMGPHTIVHDAPGDRHLTPDALAVIKPLLARCGAVVLGCGLGPHPESRRLAGLVMDEAARKRLPMLIDAEALDAVTPALLRRHGGRIVLTPHGGEFQRIAHKAASAAHVVAFAKANKTTVLRKAATDVISNGADTRLSSRGHPGLTVGGIGDVHAGSIGALLAKGTPPFEAACAGAYLVGAAGEIAASLRSYGLVATDVIEALPAVLMRLP